MSQTLEEAEQIAGWTIVVASLLSARMSLFDEHRALVFKVVCKGRDST